MAQSREDPSHLHDGGRHAEIHTEQDRMRLEVLGIGKKLT